MASAEKEFVNQIRSHCNGKERDAFSFLLIALRRSRVRLAGRSIPLSMMDGEDGFAVWSCPPRFLLRSATDGCLLNIRSWFTEIKLKNLTLHLNGSDQYPDLFLTELVRIGLGKVLKLLSHGRMLIRGGL